jgi:hypothetical protein
MKLSIVKTVTNCTLYAVLGQLCFFLAFIFGIVGVAYAPDYEKISGDGNMKTDKLMHDIQKNNAFGQFAITLALLGLGFTYVSHQ